MKQEILDITNLNQRGDLQMANLFSKKTTGWSEDGTEKNLTVLNTYDDEISETHVAGVTHVRLRRIIGMDTLIRRRSGAGR